MITSFKIGTVLSIQEMSLVIDYLIDKDSFEPELQDIKEKITNKENCKDEKII